MAESISKIFQTKFSFDVGMIIVVFCINYLQGYK